MGSQSIYQPIKWWQIRVLKLHSGEDNELLQGDLRVANVIEAESGVALHAENEYVEYEALSYCWGDPELTTDIMINAIPSKITTSLGKALERLRYPEQCRWIWCDALCIHQSDDEEKSQQVQKILSIFSRASRVIIWLGDAGPHPAAAIRCMNEGFCDLLGMGLADFTEDVWDGLCDLYSRPWIFRIWVQQETYAARDTLVYCGSDFADFELFKRLAKEFTDEVKFYRRSSRPPRAIREASRLLNTPPSATRERRARPEHMRELGRVNQCRCNDSSSKRRFYEWDNPECALHHFRGLSASRSADHVYSVLGMTNCRITSRHDDHKRGPALAGLRIDFSRSASTVFHDFTKYVLNRDGHLGLLFGHDPVSTHQNDLALPSWCPDYRNFQSHRTTGISIYHTGEYESWLYKSDIGRQSEHDSGHIVVHGVQIAEVVCEAPTGRQHPWQTSNTNEFVISVRKHQRIDGLESDGGLADRDSGLKSKRLKVPAGIRILVSRFLKKDRHPLNVDRLGIGDVLITSKGEAYGQTIPRNIAFLVLRPIDEGSFKYVDQATSFAKRGGPSLYEGTGLQSFIDQREEAKRIYEGLAKDFVIV